MNSSAAIKAFTGRNGGTICTSSNAKAALEWAFERGERVLFLPDQHLGRNTAVLELGIPLEECVVFDPRRPSGGLTPEQLRNAKMLLWKGHCSVHGRFSLESVKEVRERIPGVKVLVHPECQHEVVNAADLVGSTEFILRTLAEARAGQRVGGRHRAEPGAPARRRASGQDCRVPGPYGVFLLDNESDRPAAPGVGVGVAGSRSAGPPHHR